MATKRTAADAQESQTDDRDEGHTAAEDAFESELEGVISEALNDDEDEDDLDDEDVDDEDLDEEDDEDEDDDLDDDEEEDDVEEEEREGQPRNKDGTYAEKAKEGEAKPGEQKPDATAAGAAAAEEKKPEAAAEGPKWEGLSVNVDKQAVAIEEAKISRMNGHVFIAMPEKDYNRFQQRISRGVVGERLWRDLHNGLRELEARKNAPARKSDAEIESEITLEVLKPYLGDILDDKDVQILEARIEKAKSDAAKEYDKAETERLSKAAETPWEEQQVGGIAEAIRGLVSAYPELQSLTREELEEVYEREFLPVRNSLVFKEGDEVFANTQWMYDRLKARAESRKAASAKPDASAPAQTPDNTGHSANTATPEKGKTKKDSAERFNAGVDAGKPRTTAVKANRDTDRPRKRTTRDDEDRPRRKKVRTPRDERVESEDNWRKTERAFLNSPDLDFSVDDEDEEE